MQAANDTQPIKQLQQLSLFLSDIFLLKFWDMLLEGNPQGLISGHTHENMFFYSFFQSDLAIENEVQTTENVD